MLSMQGKITSLLHEAHTTAQGSVPKDRQVLVLQLLRELGRTHLFQFSRIYLEEVSLSQNLRNSIANNKPKALIFTSAKRLVWRVGVCGK